MAKYAVFESTNMKAVHYGGIADAVFTADIENGTFGYLDGLATISGTEKHPVVYNFKKGVSVGKPVYVVNNPAWVENPHTLADQNRDQYIVPTGTAFRAFRVLPEDKFAVTREGFTENVAVGDTVTIDGTTGKLKKLAQNGTASGISATIEYTRTIAGTRTLQNKNGSLIYICKVNSVD